MPNFQSGVGENVICILSPVTSTNQLNMNTLEKSKLYTLFPDGSTSFKKPVFHLALSDLSMQDNRDSPCQNQHNDTRVPTKTPSILTRVFSVGSVDLQTRKVSSCGSKDSYQTEIAQSFAGNTVIMLFLSCCGSFKKSSI